MGYRLGQDALSTQNPGTVSTLLTVTARAQGRLPCLGIPGHQMGVATMLWSLCHQDPTLLVRVTSFTPHPAGVSESLPRLTASQAWPSP